MNKNIKRRWTKALRSGKYLKGKGSLLEVTGERQEFCCLGVLCDIFAKTADGKAMDAGWDTVLEGGGTINFHADGEGKYDVDLPEVVMKWAGLIDTDPHLHPDADDSSLSSNINDRGHHTFNQIADLIEKNL